MEFKKLFSFFALALCSTCALAAELKVGDVAPDFSTTDDLGMPVSLRDYRGQTVILYFYPKDGTPGCTKEAENFRDHIDAFTKKKAVILGVSFDSEAAHQKFKEKYKLPFRLLIDPDKKIASAYGASGIFFASRNTFVIAPDGKLLKIYRSVSPSQHAQELLNSF